MNRSVIINADDFGLCVGVNAGVLKAHSEGVLTSATIMCNGAGADEAVEIARDIPELGVGVHLNLLEGRAISGDKRVGVLLDSENEFAISATKLVFLSMVRRDIRVAIEIELEAQIRWVVDHGISPTHLDSHKHTHAFWFIYPIVTRLARRFGITAIRWPYESSYVCSMMWPELPKGAKKRAWLVRKMAKINSWQDKSPIKTNSFFGLAHTGKIDVDFWRVLAKNMPEGIGEVMTHPGFADGLDPGKTRLIESRKVELDALCSDEVRSILSEAGIELTHYGKL